MHVELNSSKNIIRGEGRKFSNTEDVAAEVTLVGSSLRMGAKSSVKRVGVGTEISSAPADLKTQRMRIIGEERAGDFFHMIEGSERNLHVLRDIVEVTLFWRKVTAKDTDIGRRIRDVVHSLIRNNVLGDLDGSSGVVEVVRMAHGAAITKENTGVRAGMQLGFARFRVKGVNAATENSKE